MSTVYNAARSRAIAVDRSDRRFIRVHGRDPVKMIQGLITNEIADAAGNRAVYAAMLSPKGKMIADMRVLRAGDELLLDVDASALEPVVAHLRKFVPPLFAKFEDASDAWRMIGVYGPDAHLVLRDALGADVEALGEDDVQAYDDVPAYDDVQAYDDVPVRAIGTAQFDVPGFDLLVEKGAFDSVWKAVVNAGAVPADFEVLEVLRVEAGRPRWGIDLDENTIPLEAGLRERAISETKGCYTGQEVIVRILHRGHVNWHLRRLLFDDVPVPPAGTALLSPGDYRKVGRVTSAVWSPRFGQVIGLGYVRREVEPGTALHLAEATGPLVMVEALSSPVAR